MARSLTRLLQSKYFTNAVWLCQAEVPISSKFQSTSALLLQNQWSFKQSCAGVRTDSKVFGQTLKQEELKDTSEEDDLFTQETISLVNDQVARGEEGRLFAVIHVAGKQFIVTPEDIIIIHNSWPPTIGDKITFEKVLLVGGSDFTLIGRPVVSSELVSVTGTVIDKDLSHVKTRFRFQKRQQYKIINFLRSHLTMVRINDVKVIGKVNERREVEGLNKVFF